MADEDKTDDTTLEEYTNLYNRKPTVGKRTDTPKLHLYIARQIMSTVEEGTQYVAPDPTFGGTATDTDEGTTNTDLDTSTSPTNT